MSSTLRPERRQRVEFTANGQKIEIYEKDGQLYVYGTSRLFIIPNASNSIIIKPEK